jgi:transketolase
VGALTQAEIESYYEEGTRLPALPPFNAIPEIPFATGSLGYGLSLSAGMALAAKLTGEKRRFFCLTSDGELDEGSVWEAALFIAHHELKSVVWLIDRNRIQAIGRTEEVMALEPLDAKLRAFGYHVVVADGHDFRALLAARDECARVLEEGGVPVAIIANTVKGNGLSFMRDTVDCHYLPMDDAQYAQALGEVTRAHEASLRSYRNAL